MGGKKRYVFLLIAIVVLAFFLLVPAPAGLSVAGKNAFGIFLFVILLWIGNSVPKPIATLLAMLLLPLFGVVDSLSIVFENFISSVFFFLLAAFAIAAMIKDSSFPSRLMSFFLNRFHTNSKLIILAFMAVSALISTVMSDLAACALIAAISLAVFNREPFLSEHSSGFVKCVMIGIPIGSLCGGIMTPIGSPSNITIMELLSTSTGMQLSFLQWMVMGVPVGLVALILSWIALLISFKPQPLADASYSSLREEFKNMDGISRKEIKIIILLCIMFAGWIIGPSIGIDSTFVAIAGMVAMFFPGIDLLTWDDYQKEVPWDLIIMLSGLMAIAQSLLDTKAIDWFITSAMSNSTEWNPFMFLLICSTIVALLRAVLPCGPPIVIMAAPVLVSLAIVTGLNPACVVIALSTWCQITYLIPSIDALYLITYSKGYYTVPEVMRFGIPLTISLLLVISAMLLPLAVLAGV